MINYYRVFQIETWNKFPVQPLYLAQFNSEQVFSKSQTLMLHDPYQAVIRLNEEVKQDDDNLQCFVILDIVTLLSATNIPEDHVKAPSKGVFVKPGITLLLVRSMNYRDQEHSWLHQRAAFSAKQAEPGRFAK